MTPITAASAIRVVRPDTIISQRARAIMPAAGPFDSPASSASATAASRTISSAWFRELPAAKLRIVRCPWERPMMATMKSVRVADDQAGGRLDRVLATHIAELSRTRLKALIEAAAGAGGGRALRDPGP